MIQNINFFNVNNTMISFQTHFRSHGIYVIFKKIIMYVCECVHKRKHSVQGTC